MADEPQIQPTTEELEAKIQHLERQLNERVKEINLLGFELDVCKKAIRRVMDRLGIEQMNGYLSTFGDNAIKKINKLDSGSKS